MHRSATVIALLCFVPGGCASITTGSSETIAITTAPVTGASCLVTGAGGSRNVTTPGTVEVERSVKSLTVACTKPGYRDAAETIPPRLQPLSIASIVFAGPVGLFVDTQTGAINRYPDSLSVPMAV